ncbi:MAG TPA: GNAT family N-acetyltransferase [Edaphobacter sp.]
MAEILVREATGAEDVSAVRRLMQAYGEYLADHPGGAANICLEGYGRELEGLPGGYGVLLLALVDGDPSGCVALRSMKGEELACEMKRLWVDSRFRGLRLGQRLVEEAIGWAERMGFRAMYLDTVPAAMPEANRLYEAMGFMRVERYNENTVADLAFFRRELGRRT